jgi:hypothetical protein
MKLNTLLAEATAILILIDSQIRVLDELYEIVKCICRDPFDPCYNQNTVRLHYSYQENANPLEVLSPAFDIALSERNSYRQKFKGLIKSGEKAQTLVSCIQMSKFPIVPYLTINTLKLIQLMSEGASESMEYQSKVHRVPTKIGAGTLSLLTALFLFVFICELLLPAVFSLVSNASNDTVLGLGIWQARMSNLCPFSEGLGRNDVTFPPFHNCSRIMRNMKMGRSEVMGLDRKAIELACQNL